jgi:hypothetical protein
MAIANVEEDKEGRCTSDGATSGSGAKALLQLNCGMSKLGRHVSSVADS